MMMITIKTEKNSSGFDRNSYEWYNNKLELDSKFHIHNYMKYST